MKRKFLSELRDFIRAPFFSPRGFVARALLLATLFVGCHVAGWRDYTTFISGSTSSASVSFNVSVVLGLIYMLAYFGCVLAVPILLLAAAILSAIQRIFPSKRDESRPARHAKAG